MKIEEGEKNNIAPESRHLLNNLLNDLLDNVIEEGVEVWREIGDVGSVSRTSTSGDHPDDTVVPVEDNRD